MTVKMILVLGDFIEDTENDYAASVGFTETVEAAYLGYFG